MKLIQSLVVICIIMSAQSAYCQPGVSVPHKSDVIVDLQRSSGLGPPFIDDAFNYYERYVTGIRVRIPMWERIPNAHPFINLIRNSMMSIDNFLVSFRDSQGSMAPQEREWLDEMNRQVTIINTAVKTIETMPQN